MLYFRKYLWGWASSPGGAGKGDSPLHRLPRPPLASARHDQRLPVSLSASSSTPCRSDSRRRSPLTSGGLNVVCFTGCMPARLKVLVGPPGDIPGPPRCLEGMQTGRDAKCYHTGQPPVFRLSPDRSTAQVRLYHDFEDARSATCFPFLVTASSQRYHACGRRGGLHG